MPNTHGIDRVAVYETSGPTIVRIPSLIADESEFPVRQNDESGPHNPNGGKYFSAHVSDVKVRAIKGTLSDSDGGSGGTSYTQMETWDQNDTECRLAATGASFMVLWYNDDPIGVSPVPIQGKVEGRADGFDLAMSRTGSGTHDIFECMNPLGPLGPYPFADDGSGEAPGWAEGGAGTGSVVPSFLGTVQTLTTTGLTGGEDYTYAASIVCPVVGCTWTFSAEVTAAHGDADERFFIRFLNKSGSTISTTYGTSNPGTGAGSRAAGVVSVVAPATTYTVVCGVELTDITGNGALSFKEPALRLDGSSAYTTL